MRLIVDEPIAALGMTQYAAWFLSSGTRLLAQGSPVPEPPREAWRTDGHAGYRAVVEALGHPDLVPTGERPQELVAERGLRKYGGIVDVVLALTLEFGSGIGLHRVEADEEGDLVVTRSDGTLRMTPAFSSKSRPIPAGDIVYGLKTEQSLEAFAWLGKRDCDCAERQIEDDTSGAVVVLQDAIGLPDGFRAEQDARLEELLSQHLPEVSARRLELILP